MHDQNSNIKSMMHARNIFTTKWWFLIISRFLKNTILGQINKMVNFNINTLSDIFNKLSQIDSQFIIEYNLNYDGHILYFCCVVFFIVSVETNRDDVVIVKNIFITLFDILWQFRSILLCVFVSKISIHNI